jgi:hypothetical protein
MIKGICSAVLVSVLAAGTAMEANSTPSPAPQELPHLHADVDAWQVTLQDGRALGDQYGDLHINAGSVGETLTENVFDLQATPDGQYLSGAAEYQIVMLDEPTDYWIKARMFANGTYQAQCDIFTGAPSSDGELVDSDSSPFTCSTTLHPTNSTDIRFTFHVGLNREAEASGWIWATGDVSLREGVYNTYRLPFADHGSDRVVAGGVTTFDTVLRVGDTTLYENQARTEFAYRIYSKGLPTPFWVGGLSTNYRGWIFHGDGRCAIYDHNPLAGGRHLDDSAPSDQPSMFTCDADGSYKDGSHESGHGHYFTEFNIGTTT